MKKIGNPNYYKTIKNGRVVYLLVNPDKPKKDRINRLIVDPTNYGVKYKDHIYPVEGFILKFKDRIKYLLVQNRVKPELGHFIHILGTNKFRVKGKDKLFEGPIPYIVQEIELIKEEKGEVETKDAMYQRHMQEFKQQKQLEIEMELNKQLI